MKSLRLIAIVAASMSAWGAASAAEPPAMPAQAESCLACHGAGGNSKTADVPSLAGQPKQFITTQLVMFREGNRKNPAMNAVTTGLSNADINALGGWFAAQAQVPAAAPQTPEQLAAGRKLTDQFQCTQCHGADLKGQQHIPRLAGQQADYLRAQLRGFKAGTRYDMDGNMTSAAQPLSNADIDTLAEHLAALR